MHKEIMAGIILNGITWGHSRGITPLLAASQRYDELHPGSGDTDGRKELCRSLPIFLSKN